MEEVVVVVVGVVVEAEVGEEAVVGHLREGAWAVPQLGMVVEGRVGVLLFLQGPNRCLLRQRCLGFLKTENVYRCEYRENTVSTYMSD